MLLGGGTIQGLWSDAIVQLAAIPLIPWALFRLAPRQLSRSAAWAMLLLLGIIGLPLIQLVPLPPKLWAALPGRHEIVAGYEAAGMALPWLPITVDPSATWRSLWSLVAPTAIFLATLSLDIPARRVLIAALLALVFVSVPLDLLQMMGGPQSPLRFYTITNPFWAVGFFANANHNAALLYSAIPLAAGFVIAILTQQRRKRAVGLFSLSMLLAAIFIGLALTRSRAGLALGLVAGLCSLALLVSEIRGPPGRRLLLAGFAANLFAFVIVFQFGFIGLSQKFGDSDLMHDLRWAVAGVSLKAASANLPFGTGLGTFVPVYEMYAPRSLLYDRYVNHAHNDWLELLLTGGGAAAALALAFLVWFVYMASRIWRRDSACLPEVDTVCARAASIVIALLLLHSIVDYPLRTTALDTVFALAYALLVPPVRRGPPFERAPLARRSRQTDSATGP